MILILIAEINPTALYTYKKRIEQMTKVGLINGVTERFETD